MYEVSLNMYIKVFIAYHVNIFYYVLSLPSLHPHYQNPGAAYGCNTIFVEPKESVINRNMTNQAY